ncbi:MAG: DUF4148 domain-containing protein [Pseudorhodoferax sp.]
MNEGPRRKARAFCFVADGYGKVPGPRTVACRETMHCPLHGFSFGAQLRQLDPSMRRTTRLVETEQDKGSGPAERERCPHHRKESIMNTKFLASALIAAVGFAAAPSFAGDNISGEVGYVPQVSSAKSDLTRATVRAEYLQAERNGTLPEVGEGADVGAVATARSGLTRDAVRAEAVYAVRHGQLGGGEV